MQCHDVSDKRFLVLTHIERRYALYLHIAIDEHNGATGIVPEVCRMLKKDAGCDEIMCKLSVVGLLQKFERAEDFDVNERQHFREYLLEANGGQRVRIGYGKCEWLHAFVSLTAQR